MGHDGSQAQFSQGQRDLLEAVRSFGGDAARDCWVFDAEDQVALYLRDDVADALTEVEVERYLDNERYGFVTRDTYEALHYASFRYTVRGFDAFDQFRSFLEVDGERVGVLASFDRDTGGFDYAALDDRLAAIATEYGVADLEP